MFEKKLHVLYSDEEISALTEKIKACDDPVAVDSETTGLSASAEVVGISLAQSEEEAYYIVTAEWRVDIQNTIVNCETCNGLGILLPGDDLCSDCEGSKGTEKTEFLNGHLFKFPNKEKVIELLQVIQTKQVVMHNAPVDWNWIKRNYGVDLLDAIAFDTMTAAHLVNENRRVSLKELGYTELGDESAKNEQAEMKESVIARGGIWETKRGGNKEMFKAESHILGLYGAQDALLTLRLFYRLAPQLQEQGLTDFYYEECLPLLLGPTCDLSFSGIKCDLDAFAKLQSELKIEIALLENAVQTDIAPYVKDEYPKGFGNGKNQFNFGSGNMLAWLLFVKLKNDWKKLTDSGRDLAKSLIGRAPYNPSGRRQFAKAISDAVDIKGQPLKIQKYLKVDKKVLKGFSEKYVWINNLLEMRRLRRLLNSYAEAIPEQAEYGIIRPSFMQTGTTSGRYSSKSPNFQNLPREDKRIKSCLIARPGKVFVGADQSQLEPRVFASISGDFSLLACFESGQDFYSVVGAPVFGHEECSLFKEDKDSFAKKFPHLRDRSKVIALATPYGRTAIQQAEEMGISIDEAQELIDKYFQLYPSVEKMMHESHEMAKKDGAVYSFFGRPRRIPEAKKINRIYGNKPHRDLPYEARTLLNLGMNHRVQSTASSVMNRIAIALFHTCRELEALDSAWTEVKQVLQVHDEIVLEGPESLANDMSAVLKDAMENTVSLPGVKFVTEPKIGRRLSDLK